MNKTTLFTIFSSLSILLFACNEPAKHETETKHEVNTNEPESNEPVFKKEGELAFKRNGAAVTSINIEIAESDDEKKQGLMWRSHMEEANGMLFIFETSGPQAFWMKNTIIPLDILFVSQDSTVNTIHRFTQPYSEQSLPAKQASMFVVEVNGGFCDRHGITEGDKISFRKI